MRIPKKLSVLVASCVASAGVLTLAPAAHAAPAGSVESTAAAVAKATAQGGLQADQVSGSAASALISQAAGTVVEAPTAAEGAVTSTHGTATVAIGLPSTATTQTAKRVASGTAVYADPNKPTDLAVQALADGSVRTLVTLKSSDAPRDYRFPLSLPTGATLLPMEGGRATVIGSDGKPLGGFDAPWAVDAAGHQIPTTYTIEGSTLVQHVEVTSTTAFPVVADPKWTWGIISGTVYLNKHETNEIVLGASLGSIGLGAINAIAGMDGAALAAYASYVEGEGHCIKFKSGTNWSAPVAPGEYWGGYCS